MLSLDEAIEHCEEKAEEEEKQAIWLWSREGNPYYTNCVERAKEHRQLAEWLKELKKYRAIFEKVGKIFADKIFADNGYTMDDLDTIFGKVNEEVNADEDGD